MNEHMNFLASQNLEYSSSFTLGIVKGKNKKSKKAACSLDDVANVIA